MKTLRSLLVFTIILFIIKACSSPETGINSKEIKDEINNRKIRRISEALIIESSFARGKKVMDSIRVTAENHKDLSSDTLTRFGSLQPLVDHLQQENKAEIKKVLDTDLKGNSLKKQEREIFEAYQYNIEQGLKVDDNVQILEKHIFYAAPIVENGELKGMWSIFFDKGELIKGISEN
jgi:hypothetical protein